MSCKISEVFPYIDKALECKISQQNKYRVKNEKTIAS
jgi:hypothetical protein